MLDKPFLLLCNDDGIHATGIKVLWHTLKESNLFDLAMIAPAHERSGSGCAITWDRPLLVKKIEWPDEAKAWSVDGSPADCIKMGLSVILDRRPNLIISGINAGSNAGRNVLHSGTIGAVIEGILHGIGGIAFSCESGLTPNFHVAAKYIIPMINYLLSHPLPAGSFLNVNFPESASDVVKGIKWTRQGMGRWIEDPSFHMKTNDGSTYWLGGKPEERTENPHCDISLLRQGYMTVVPIHVHELTDQLSLRSEEENFSQFLEKMRFTVV